MLQYQIDDLKKAVTKVLGRSSRPPERVGIKLAHAEYLGLRYTMSKPINEKGASPFRPGVLYGSVVMVALSDLYSALQEAVGVDRKETKRPKETSDPTGQAQDPEPDHSAEAQESEGTDGS